MTRVAQTATAGCKLSGRARDDFLPVRGFEPRHPALNLPARWAYARDWPRRLVRSQARACGYAGPTAAVSSGKEPEASCRTSNELLCGTSNYEKQYRLAAAVAGHLRVAGYCGLYHKVHP